MEKYIKPTIKVKEIELDAILAASDPTAPADTRLDDDTPVSDVTIIESKRNNTSLWDE